MSSKKLTALVAPLDWGLGHATRCIPLIDALLKKKAHVLIGGSGRSLLLLRDHYPDLPSIELPAYDVRYARGPHQGLAMLRQLPHLLRTISREHQVLKELISEQNIDICFSDNRYGLWNPALKSIFIGHQLAIQMPAGLSFMQPLIFRLHKKMILRFDQCWVPDFPGENNLSGKLSHDIKGIDKLTYIGPLSRFGSKLPIQQEFSDPRVKKSEIDIVAILSGPEPQRTMLEEILVKEAGLTDRKILIVQGKTENYRFSRQRNLSRLTFMDKTGINLLISHARLILSRPGYSSLMDYAALGVKQLVLIPTPGQTEQEYLAHILETQNVAPSLSQQTFKLAKALNLVSDYNGFSLLEKNDLLQAAIEDLTADMQLHSA